MPKTRVMTSEHMGASSDVSADRQQHHLCLLRQAVFSATSIADPEFADNLLLFLRDDGSGTPYTSTAFKIFYYLRFEVVLPTPCALGGAYYSLLAFRSLLLRGLPLPDPADVLRLARLWLVYERALYAEDIKAGLHPENEPVLPGAEPVFYADKYRHSLTRDDISNGPVWAFWLQALVLTSVRAQVEKGFVVMFLRYFQHCSPRGMAECLLPRLLPEDAATPAMDSRLLSLLIDVLPCLFRDLDGHFADSMLRRCVQRRQQPWLRSIASESARGTLYLTESDLELVLEVANSKLPRT